MTGLEPRIARTLELGRAHPLELQAASQEMGRPIVRRTLRDFTVWPVRRA
jgi:hypothetical protein